MKKLILYFIPVLLLFSACAKESDLTVHNDTGQTVTVKIDHILHLMYTNSEPVVETYFLNSFIFYGETKKVPVEYVGTPYLKQNNFTIEMKPGKDKVYHVELNLACLTIRNLSPGLTITKVRLMDVGSVEWTEEYEVNIAAEEIETISVEPGDKFVQIEDIYESIFQSEYFELIAGETSLYNFFGFK
ncbi:MAG: hypothetical protein ISS80_06105 [Candidatus Cloacimonetes bacterium]|nr:hypothetical protein [Candidatus Cloacimonadota bacterium]MBL7149629.1 hypothetical protein [Candidatus Cloacimonadota bacterium]